MYMKKGLLLVLFLYAALYSGAQEIEAVDSIDVETGIIYPANGVAVETPDTISADSIMKPSVIQVPLDSCNSLMVRNADDRYGVVWKDGKCGIYDITKWENVTNIDTRNFGSRSGERLRANTILTSVGTKMTLRALSVLPKSTTLLSLSGFPRMTKRERRMNNE